MNKLLKKLKKKCKKNFRQEIAKVQDLTKDMVEEIDYSSQFLHLPTQIYDELSKSLKNLQHEVETFQVVYPFIQWIWPDSEPGSIHPTVYTIADQIPLWGEFYRPSTAGLYNSYKSMLAKAPRLSIDFLSDPRIDCAEQKVRSAWDRLKAAEEEVKESWIESFKSDPDLIYGEWFETSGWAESVEKIHHEFDVAVEEKVQLISEVNQDYTTALNAVTVPKGQKSPKKGFVKCKSNGVEFWRPNYIFAKGNSWTAQSNDGVGPVKFDLSNTLKAFLQETNISLIREIEQLILGALDQSVTVQFEFAELKKVTVEPDEWFFHDYLEKLAQENHWNHPFTTDTIFGREGLVSLRIAQMLAAYKLKFTIVLPNGVFNLLHDAFLALEELKLGPLRFSKGEWAKYTDDSKLMLRGESTSDNPFIIGFITTNPGL